MGLSLELAPLPLTVKMLASTLRACAAHDAVPAFDIAERRTQFDIVATVKGGGLSGQAGAVRHGQHGDVQL